MEGPERVILFGHGSIDLQNLWKGQEAVAQQVADILTQIGLIKYLMIV